VTPVSQMRERSRRCTSVIRHSYGIVKPFILSVIRSKGCGDLDIIWFKYWILDADRVTCIGLTPCGSPMTWV
jgi:hypothetical protein